MKRLLLGVTIFAAAALLAGCPIYSSSGNYRVCDANGCWDCPDRTYSDACISWRCNTSFDCGAGYMCNAANACVLPSVDAGTAPPPLYCANSTACGSGSVCGRDGTCHRGDCGTWGCSVGYTCLVSNGVATCTSSIPTGSDAATPGVDASDASVSDASDASTDAADASDAKGDVVDAAPVAVPCNSDLACGGAGARCVNGVCTAKSSLCSDSSQCTGANEVCVDGLCTPTCSGGGGCPVGFDCDLTNGRDVCSLGGCTSTADCFNGGVCVEGHCALGCSADAGDASSCPSGEICVNGGCIPDQHAIFTCTNNGNSGALANTCGAESVCLHHDCYAVCGSGDGADGCLPSQVCTLVQTPSGASYRVCGTGSNLGSACDPAASDAPRCPAGDVCIDGHCR